MKTRVIVLFFISLFLILANNHAAVEKAVAVSLPSNADARVSYFYEQLLPYGEWIWNNTYGWVWSPYNIPINWRPYTDGYWVSTDYGWAWVSSQPWGWACFHYGRWFYDTNYGWLWYPDTVWAPCWVVWRTEGDFIGWAPLPPKAIWRSGKGLAFKDSDADHISWHAYTFCDVRDFTNVDLARHFITHARNVTLLKQTKIIANTITIVNNRVINRVPFQDKIVKAAGHPIPNLTVARAESPENHGISGNELRVFRPELNANVASTVTVAAKPKSAELAKLHESDLNALQKMQKNRQSALEEEHAQQMKNPPSGMTKEQLAQQHKIETNALQEQSGRERQLLQSQHEREARIATSTKVPTQRHFNVSVSEPGSKAGKQATKQSEGARREK
jgi:hypothetical protein